MNTLDRVYLKIREFDNGFAMQIEQCKQNVLKNKVK